RLAHSLSHRCPTPTGGITLKRDAERDSPKPAGKNVARMRRVPPMTRYLASMSACGLDMETVDRARNFGHQVGPLAGANQCLQEQHESVSPHDAADRRFPIALRCVCAPPSLFGTPSNMEHVATRGLNEQTSIPALPPKADIGAPSLLNLRYPGIRIV